MTENPLVRNCEINNEAFKCNLTSSLLRNVKIYFGLAESESKKKYYNHKKPKDI